MPRLIVFALFLGLALGQATWRAGVGGADPWNVGKNPAVAAVRGRWAPPATFDLPLGYFGLLALPDRSPLYAFLNEDLYYEHFDLLTAVDQGASPDALLLNPARSPKEVVIEVGKDGARVTDASGRPLSAWLARPRSIGQESDLGYEHPLGRDLGLGFGLKTKFKTALEPNAALSALLREGRLEANTDYTLTMKSEIDTRLEAGLAYVIPLPELELEGQRGKLFVGVRGGVFLSLGYLEEKSALTVRTDEDKNVERQTTTTTLFYSLVSEHGPGFGGQFDLGLVWETEEGFVGLGLRDLVRFYHYRGTELVLTEEGENKRAAQKSGLALGFKPHFGGAWRVPLEGYPAPLLAVFDLGYDEAPYVHLGGELPVGPLRARAGVGYRDGFSGGLGAGLELGPARLDLALTTRQSIVDGHLTFGIAAGVGF